MRPLSHLHFFLVLILASGFLLVNKNEEILGLLESWHYNVPQEKVYIKQDKPYYVLGETLWFKAFVVNAVDHSFLVPSETLYVELRDSSGVVQESKNILINQGAGSGDFLLNPGWAPGTYHLHAYTSYMLNFDQDFHFVNTFEIGSVREGQSQVDSILQRSTVELDLYPEGGQLVCGLSSVVAARSFDEEGKPASVKAQVFDESGKLITLFMTNPEGYGKFTVVPDCSKRYHIKLLDTDGDSLIFLPPAQESGLVLSVKNAHLDKLFVQVTCSGDLDLAGCALVGHRRGEHLWLQNKLTGKQTTFEISATDLAPGVHHITLFDHLGQPRAERLFYRHGIPKAIRIESSDGLATNSLNRLELSLIEPLDDEEVLQSAMSIYQADLGLPNQTLSSYLLLNSDIKGSIDNLTQYFPANENPKLQEIDLLLLTHGWRRFDWSDVIAQQFPNMSFMPESGFTLRGEIQPDRSVRKNTQPALVQITLLNNEFETYSVLVDSSGAFALPNIEIADSTKVLLKAIEHSELTKKSKQKKQRVLDLALYTRESAIDTDLFARRRPSILGQSRMKEYIDIARYNEGVSQSYADVWSIDLDEIVVSETRKDPEVAFHERTMLYSDPDTRLLVKDVPGAIAYNNVFDFLQARVPGLEVRGSFPNKTVRIRGTSTIKGDPNAQFMLDGAYVPNDLLNYYPMERVAFVDVIRSLSKATVLGGTAGGIVAIYSKSTQPAVDQAADLKTISLRHPGYYKPTQYYVPKNSEITDAYLRHRTTLYWNADIDLSRGTSKHTFYTSDRLDHYFVLVEGITNKGRLFQGLKKITVR